MSEQHRTIGREYLEKYFDAYIGRGNKRFYSTVPAEFNKVDFKELYTVDPYDAKTFIEESVDISMRENNFQRLLDVLGYFQQNGNNNASYYIKDIQNRLDFERLLREKYPALKKAYEHYRTLVAMVANGQEIED
jgi:hypothetical protein